MIVNRHGQRDLCLVLSDDIAVHVRFDFLRGREGIGKLQVLCFPVFHFVSQDARAQIDALVADVNIRAGNNPVDLFLPLAAERAADGISCHGPSPLTHIHFRENGAKPSGKEGISSLARTCYLFYRL